MVFSNNLLLGAGGQSTGPTSFDTTLIGNSVWLDGTADYFSKTPAVTGNQRRFTFAFWVQRHSFGEVAPGIYSAGDGTQNNDFNIYWNNSGGGSQAGDTLCVSQITGGSAVWRIYTEQLFRDIGWYHFIISIDTTESAAPDRVKIYLNGDEITSFASASYPSLNADVDYVNDSANEQRIGRNQGSNYVKGSAAQFVFVEGKSIQADLTVSDILDAFEFGTNGSQFGPKSNAAITALAANAFGTNSFALDFSDSAYLGHDSRPHNFLTYSEQFNQWTAAGTTVTANNMSGPFGNFVADKVETTSAGTYRYITQTAVVPDGIAGKTITISTYIYADTTFDFVIRTRGTGSTQEPLNSTVSTVGGEWTRVSFTRTFTSSADGTGMVVTIYTDHSVSGQNHFWLFGAQAEQGTLGTYVPTPKNLLLRTEEFDNSYWSKLAGSTATANQTVAPDGTTTADLMTAGNSVYGSIAARRDVSSSSIPANTSLTASIYCKKINHRYIGIRLPSNIATLDGLGHTYTFFDFDTASFTEKGTLDSTSVETLGNGWYRIAVTGTMPSTVANTTLDFALVNSTGNSGAAPAGTETVYFWGAQLETGGLSSYRPISSTAAINVVPNNLTPESMDSTNQTANTPSLVYPVWNALEASATLSNGNLNARSTTSQLAAQATQSVSSGKFYWEITANSSADQLFGITGEAVSYANRIAATFNYTPTVFFYGVNGNIYQDGSSTTYDSAISVGDVIGIAVDFDAGKIWFAKNNAWLQSGDPANGTSPSATFTVGTFTPSWCAGGASGDRTGATDFGQLGFTYTPPTDFVSLASSNLTAPSYQGIDYFAPTLYEGNGTGQRVGDFVPFTDAFNVANSAMFQHDEARALSRTAGAPSSSGGKKGTWSTWYKTANIDTDNIFFDNGTTATNRFSLQMDASGQIVFMFAGTTILMTNADLKGGGLWRNLVLKVDTSLATASARAIMYIDGVEVTSFATDARASLTQDGELGYMDSGATQFVGSYNGVTANQWDGYLAETIFLDNQFLSADSFGQLDTSTNKWVPKDISGLTLGDQGFYLAYGGNFGTGNGAGDSTGNSNNLTEIGTWTSADKFVDTPTKNFTIFDSGYSGGGSNVWSEGNTKVKGTDGSLSDSSTTTFGMTGKVVFQFQINTVVSGGYPQVGFITSQAGLSAINASSGSIELGTASVPGSFAYTDTGTFKIPAGTESTTFSSVTSLQVLDADDVIRFEVDTSTGTIRAYFQNEGTGSFSEITGARVDSFSFDPSFGIRPAVSNFNNSIVTLQTGGQTALASVTTDYKEINQDNLDDTASKITALAWIKNRDATDNHMLFDRVRGVGNDIHSNDVAAQVFNANTVQRFLQRGVQIGSDVEVNTANESYVLWQWLLGDSATTGSTNADGSVNTTVIAADAGHFSIVKGTTGSSGATFGHGLGAAPDLIINKDLSSAGWLVYSSAFDSADNYMQFNATNSVFTGSTVWGTDATSTVFTLGSFFNTVECINYCFRSVPGVCKVGSYIGNGSSADGPYISTGFKPKWLMVKWTSGGGLSSEGWLVKDTVRQTINPNDDADLYANFTTAETTGATHGADILADGFKLRGTGGANNVNGAVYLYLAMADIGGNGTLPPMYGR